MLCSNCGVRRRHGMRMRKMNGEHEESAWSRESKENRNTVMNLVFKSPAQSSFSAKFQWTGITTSCLLWKNLKDWTETKKPV